MRALKISVAILFTLFFLVAGFAASSVATAAMMWGVAALSAGAAVADWRAR